MNTHDQSDNPFSFVLTAKDYSRLEAVLAVTTDETVRAMLRTKLARSRVMFGTDIAPDIVTIGSRVQISLTGQDRGEIVVGQDDRLPHPAGVGQLALSSPLAIALLGCKAGQSVIAPREDGVVAGVTLLAVLSQPEASVRGVGDVVPFPRRRAQPVSPFDPDDPGPSAA